MTLTGIDILIVARPDKEGRPYIAGTSVSVARFASLVDEGLSAREMYDDVFAGALTMAQIHAALACYYENRSAIDGWLDEQNAEYDRNAAASQPA